MNIKTLLCNLINSLLDSSFERVRIISQMNAAFKEYFTTGEFYRLCKVSISQGNSVFAHEMCTLWIRSGFRISIENDASLKESEINELTAYTIGQKKRKSLAKKTKTSSMKTVCG